MTQTTPAKIKEGINKKYTNSIGSLDIEAAETKPKQNRTFESRYNKLTEQIKPYNMALAFAGYRFQGGMNLRLFRIKVWGGFVQTDKGELKGTLAECQHWVNSVNL